MGNNEASAQPIQEQSLPGRAVTAVVCVGLTLLVLLVYAQVGNFDFVTLDDNAHVYENPQVRTGLNRENVAWAFGVHGPGQWHPLAYLSHQGVYEYLGADARPHHLVNLAFHVASVVVLLLALRKMTGRLWPSAFVAAMFGLHPLSVESVAWICERRDVMCALFWMLTLWAYAGYAQRGGTLRYVSVALCCALALMSKPMAVTLPCALLLLDLWPLRRMPFGTRREDENVTGAMQACPPKSLPFLVLEKLPLLGLAAVSSLLSILSHQQSVVSLEAIPLQVRVANALIAYVVYLRKMIWPADLCVWYPHPALQPSFQLSSLIWAALGAALLLLAITAFVIYQARRRPYLAVGWFWYLGVLFPVSGLFQVGGHAYADRFAYLPLIGIYVAIAWGAAELISKWPLGQLAVKVATPVLLVACMTTTSIQIATWRDSRTLYQHALSKTKDNSFIHYILGTTLEESGFPQEAVGHYQQALRIKPDYVEVHNSWGNALQALGRPQEAVGHYQQALRIKPDFAEVHNNWGNALQALGRPQEAIAHYQQTLRIKPDFAEAHYNWGNVLQALGHPQEAIAHYQDALRIKLDYAEAHYNCGVILQKAGRVEQAIVQYQQALRIKPDYAEVHNNWGNVLKALGRPQEAIAHYQDALRIKPDYALAHYNWALALQEAGQVEQAVMHYQQALRIKPDYALAHNNWGIALAGSDRFEEAVAHYQQALRIKPDFAEAHHNWGLALEALGRRQEALSHYRQAMRINPTHAPAYNRLGAVLVALGRFQEARTHYDNMLRHNPKYAMALNNLAWLLATCPLDEVRDGQRAVQLASRLEELQGRESFATLDTLAAAHAEAGQFDEAVQWQQQAILLAPDAQREVLRRRLELYQQGKPYREPQNKKLDQ